MAETQSSSTPNDEPRDSTEPIQPKKRRRPGCFTYLVLVMLTSLSTPDWATNTLKGSASASMLDNLSRKQHLLLSAADQNGQIKVRDLAWEPIALAPAGVYERILRQLDAIVEEIKSPPVPRDATEDSEVGVE